MLIQVDNKEYEITIIYKNNKNMYLRIKDDLSIVITAPFGITEKRIKKFILENYDYIAKVIRNKSNILNEKKDKFLYLGKYYDICYVNKKSIELGNSRAFIGKNVNIDNWYKKKAKQIFENLYEECFYNFDINKEKPLLKIRKMKGDRKSVV